MPTQKRIDRITEVLSRRQKGLVLVLEDIHDPHNAGAVLRSAEAFGVEEVCIIYEKEKYVNLKRVGRHSSSSANKWVPIRTFRSTKSCYAYLRRKKCRIMATVLHEQSKSIFSLNLTQPRIALVMGNEHRGLSPYAIHHADTLVHIPMNGFVESLNLSVSASIMLFETLRQRLASGKRYSFTKAEIEKQARRFF